jgi:glycosyltransferase involved in cell wall biosynthesis
VYNGAHDAKKEILVYSVGKEDQAMSVLRYSIIITCYNQQFFITEAVESALSQNCSSKEVIVVDDGSQDGSLDTLRQYAASIKLLSLSINHGYLEARNRGAAIAQGEYLLFLDGDDVLPPWAFDVYELLIAERHPTTIVSSARWFEGPVSALRLDDVPKRVDFVEYDSLMTKDRTSGLYNGAFVIDRQAFHDCEGYSPGLSSFDDKDLFLRLGFSGKAIVVLFPYTFLYRVHAGGMSRSVPRFISGAYAIIERERAGRYPGGPRRRFERYAYHGGMIYLCMMRGLRAGCYREVIKLVSRGWLMIVAAIIRRAIVRLRGHRPLETCELRTTGVGPCGAGCSVRQR